MTRSVLVLSLLAALLCAAPATAATLPAGFEEEQLVTGLTEPVAVDWTPDGRTLVLEKPGRLLVAAPGSKSATVVYNFTSKVNQYHDRGALGLAVDSSYATNGYVYLLYTREVNELAGDGNELGHAQRLGAALRVDAEAFERGASFNRPVSEVQPGGRAADAIEGILDKVEAML